MISINHFYKKSQISQKKIIFNTLNFYCFENLIKICAYCSQIEFCVKILFVALFSASKNDLACNLAVIAKII